MIAWVFVPAFISEAIPSNVVLPILFLLACVSVFGFYSQKKPKGAQTSYFQPVRLKKVKQKFSGEIIGYVIAFTNEVYKRKFISANSEAVAKKVIEVVPS